MLSLGVAIISRGAASGGGGAATLASVDADYGPRAGGSTHTVTGTGFVAGDVIKVGDVSCSTTFVNATTLTFTAADWATNAIADAAHDVTLWRGGVLQATLASAFFTWAPGDYSIGLALLPDSLTQSGGVVTGWANRGSGGATTVTTNGSPAYVANEATLGDRPCVSFTAASSQWLRAVLSGLASTNELELFQAISAPSMAGNPTFAIAVPSSAVTDYAQADGLDVLYAATSTNLEIYRNGSYANVAGLSAGAAMALHARWAANGANDGSVVRINGTESTTLDRAGHTSFAIDTVLLGARIASSVPTTPFTTYKCSALLLKSGALTSGQRAVVLAFMSWMFGVTA